MDTMYKFQPIMQLARKIDSDEITVFEKGFS